MQAPVIDLLNIDCLEYMRAQPDKAFDLAIVDPPYGGNDAINPKSSASVYKAKRPNYHEFENVPPPPEYFEQLKRISKAQIIWGANFFDAGLIGGRIVWDKKGTAFGRSEIAYYSESKSVSIVEVVWNGMLQHDMKNKETRIHPTQKPVKLYEALLAKYAKPGFKLFDSHLGSASIAIACHNFGFDLTACEIDSFFYQGGVDRFENHKRQLRIW